MVNILTIKGSRYTPQFHQLFNKKQIAYCVMVSAYDECHGYWKPHENLSAFNRETWLSALKQKKSLDEILPAAIMTVTSRSIQVLVADGKK